MQRKELVLKVKDLMTRNLVSVDAEASVVETATLMVEKGIASVLVRHGEESSGMIIDRDIISRVLSKGADPTGVRDPNPKPGSMTSEDVKRTIR